MIGVELVRIKENNQGGLPDTTKMVIVIDNLKKPEQVLEKTKEVITAVSKFAFTNNWPEDEEWKSILPKWFVESMVDKSEDELLNDENQWHFESWVESMYHRAWIWYSSELKGDKLTIVLETLNVPYVFEQFLYIFYSQGIDMTNISVVDDIYD